MNVYSVPSSSTRYALYCEVTAPAVDDGDESSASWIERMKGQFRRAVDEGEAAEYGEVDEQKRGRLRRFITRKLAEAVAEQRLLWHLRDETTARLFHPDTMDGEQALALARAEFTADYGRHRRWLIIDTLLTAITGPLLFLVPGPNVLSWYFTFRAVGHFLAMRGARRALSDVTWTSEATPHLTSVAIALGLPPGPEREARLEAAGRALGLVRLAAFAERVAERTSK
jgi:hypothetical protein